jgi:hypothetical protein
MMQKYQTVPKNYYFTFCKLVGHDNKDYRTMELMREITSDAYRVQAEMMTQKEMPQFNQAPAPYNTAQQQFNIAQQPYNNAQPLYNPTQPQYNTAQYNHAPQYNVPRGDRTGYRGGGRARGGFRRSRGPVTCHNCQQSGHYAQECTLPPVTCMYCRASDHDIEDCLTLLVKIQENMNQKNWNVQWISAEARENGQNINIVTRGGMKTGNDAVRKEPAQNQWVKNNTEPRKYFNAPKENDTFKEAREEFQKMGHTASTSTVQPSHEAPEYEIPPSLDHTNKMPPKGQVITIKNFLQSCVKMLSDPSSVKILQNILDKCSSETEQKLEPKTVNHLHTRRRTIGNLN